MAVTAESNVSYESKMRSPDRVLVLKVMDGKKVLSNGGFSDPRLFSGENKLHAMMDPQTCMWKLKYDMGTLPEPLKGTFTGFRALKQYVQSYFEKRNIEIVEVKD